MRGADRRPAGQARVHALADRDRHADLPQRRRGARSARDAARRGDRGGGRARPRAAGGLDASVRDLDYAKAHRARPLSCAVRGDAGRRAPAADLRNARACRHRGRRAARRPDEPVQLFLAAPARVIVLIAPLGRYRYRPEVFSVDHLRRAAAHRRTGALRELCRISADHPRDDAGRADRRRVEDLVGYAPERSLPDARDPHHGRLHRSRRRRLSRGARRIVAADAVALALRQSTLAYVFTAVDSREPLARDALQLRSGHDRSRPRQGHPVPAIARGAARARARGCGGARLHAGGAACAHDSRARHQRPPAARGAA